MPVSDSGHTCWTLIRGAAAGNEADRSAFVRQYGPVVRAYLRARWRGSALVQDVEDAVQEVFLDCFRQDGLLDTVDASRPGGFRPFLYAAARNVARHAETKKKRSKEHQPPESEVFGDVAGRDEQLSRVFDKAWALSVVQEALRRMEDPSQVELLRERFHEGRPIRDIAARLEEDPARLHKAYRRARLTYEAKLLEVVLDRQPGSRADAIEECRRLIALLG